MSQQLQKLIDELKGKGYSNADLIAWMQFGYLHASNATVHYAHSKEVQLNHATCIIFYDYEEARENVEVALNSVKNMQLKMSNYSS